MAEQNYEGQRWVTYDQRSPGKEGPEVTDSRLYNEAFTVGLLPAVHTTCKMTTDVYCTSNPMLSYYLAPVVWPTAAGWSPMVPIPSSSTKSSEICCRFNEGRCRNPRCKHCLWSQAPHLAVVSHCKLATKPTAEVDLHYALSVKPPFHQQHLARLPPPRSVIRHLCSQ